MNKTLNNMTLALAAAVLMAPMAQAAVSNQPKLSSLENEVRHELVMLPWFGVFDNLAFEVQGDHVILSGQVTRPTLRSDAEGVVRHIEGVERITNKIEVLPLSPHDDRIRMAAYYSIYGYGPLNRYALGSQPPIRIIVKNGNITLQGVVANKMDANLAYMRARGVSGAFSVTNELHVENARS